MSYKNKGFVADSEVQQVGSFKKINDDFNPVPVSPVTAVTAATPGPTSNQTNQVTYSDSNPEDTAVVMGFSPSVSSDSKPAIGTSEETRPLAEKPYAGMGKEDLLRFSSTPFWTRLRMACLILFWLAWLGLLVAVIVLTVIFPRCKAPSNPIWWQNASFYQIYVKSFYDSDGDGTGDLKGIEAKLDHLKDIKSTGMVLSAFYVSRASGDFGYDWTDHKDVNSEVGNMDQFNSLLVEAHEKGLKVILDFVPNHTGNDTAWFTDSKNKRNNKDNFYVWADCDNTTTPVTYPNNWKSLYGRPAWSYDTTRGQCYLHQFLSTQPDLNLRSGLVKEELEKILRFWLDKGVDGFRVNSAGFLFEDYDLRDEPLSGVGGDGYDSLNHTYTFGLPETHEVIARWRSILREYNTSNVNHSRVLMTDAEDTQSESIKYYGISSEHGSGLPINYILSNINPGSGGTKLQEGIKAWLENKPANTSTPWMSGNQDRIRLASRVGTNYGNVINMLKMTLPGTAIHYYGEEIGMVNVTVSMDNDPVPEGFKRSPFRTPMQWDNATNAGFVNGTARPWLPVAPGNSLNVKDQQSGQSSLRLFKNLGELREQQEALWYGNTHYMTDTSDTDGIFSFVREFDGKDRLLIMANMGQATKKTKLNKRSFSVPHSADIAFSTTWKTGSSNLEDIDLAAGEGIIFKWAYSR